MKFSWATSQIFRISVGRRLTNPNKDFINGTCAALRFGRWHCGHQRGYVIPNPGCLLIHTCIHDIPAAVDCISVTNTVCCHNAIHRATSKPTNCTGNLVVPFLPDAGAMKWGQSRAFQDAEKCFTSFDTPSGSKRYQVICRYPALTSALAF